MYYWVKKGKRKVQGVPQSQTAAPSPPPANLPPPTSPSTRHQEEEETDISKQAQIEQTYEKHQDYLSLPQARQSQHQKDRKTQEQNDTW